jgi:putative endonuclease
VADFHDLGQKGETLAAKYLIGEGYTIRERNWTYGKKEIDIIAETDTNIVFVEVKTRMADYYVHPNESVTVQKQRLLIFAAEAYIQKKEIEKENRFDLIHVIFDQMQYHIEHVEEAFYPTL